MTHTMAGPEGITPIGRIVDLPEQKAVQLVTDGFATYVGPVPDAAEIAEAMASEFDEIGRVELREMCKAKGLSAKGGKPALIARLEAAKQAEEDSDDQPDKDSDEQVDEGSDENTSLETPENAVIR